MNQQRWILGSIGCGTFLATLDSSVVNIALPTLTEQFSCSLSSIQWVVIIYLLLVTCLLLPFGCISDQYGRKRILQLGFWAFILGSALCGCSTTFGQLIFFRGVQAMGAAMLMSNGPAIITTHFSSAERGSALGTLAMAVSAGLMTGPSLGGFLIVHWGWRSIFFINIPIGLLGMSLAHIYLEKDRKNSQKFSFDVAGAVIQVLILALVIFLFNPPHLTGFEKLSSTPMRWILGGVLLGLLILFFKVEHWVTSPLFEFSLLRNKTFFMCNLASFLLLVSISSVSTLMPFFLEDVLEFPPQKAGLFMTVIPLAIFITAPFSGRLSDRMGSHGLSIAGTAVGVIALFLLATIQKTTSAGMLVFEFCLIGLSIGFFQPPNNSAIMGAVPHEKLGVASALLATIRNLGLVTSTGLMTHIFTWRFSLTHQFTTALHWTFNFAGIIGMGAVLTAFLRKKSTISEI